MKKIKVLLLIVFLLTLTSCQKSTKSASSPLFFEVSKNGSVAKIYLLGSIHAADETAYPLPKTIMDAYNESDYLAVEFDIIKYTQNIGEQVSLMQKFMYEGGKTIKDDVDEKVYDKMESILSKANLYSSLYDKYIPIIWSTLIDNAEMSESGLDEEYGIDMHFLNMAKEDKKKILELESAEAQYNVLLNLSDELSLQLLKDSVNNYNESIVDLKNLYEAYKRGNKDELESLVFTSETDELTSEYNEELIDKRNIGMFKGLDKQFRKGETVFCTVGLAHIIGENGLVSIFEQNGYTVAKK